MTGEKEILVFYNIGDSESVKYWTSILNDIKNRRVKDILMKNRMEFTKKYVIIVRKEAVTSKYKELEENLVSTIKEIN